MSNLIPLQTATITQFPQSFDKSWYVRTADANEELGVLPDTLNAKEAMSYLHFARPFELKALNIGINHGRKQMATEFENVKIALHSQIKFLEQENQRLANELERMIVGDQ